MVRSPAHIHHGQGRPVSSAATPRSYDLSATQARALQEDASFALTAGAGSGKTHTLTALVARDLIEHHIAPEDILVCTFTRAAAANVTARIDERLLALAPDRAGEATLRLMCGTIDAVCGRLVAERALDLGIPIALSPGDERELAPLRHQAAALVLAELPPEAVDVLRAAFSPMPERLGQEIQAFHDRAIRMRVDVNALHVPPASPPSQADIDSVITAIEKVLATGLANPTATTKLIDDLELLRAGKVMDTSGKPGNTVAAIKPAVELVKMNMLRLKQHVIDSQLRPAALAIAEALRLYDAHYRALKEQAGIADYTDIAELALDLSTLPHPRRFRRVYVDEAQDTSPLQMDVLKSLVAPGGAMIPVGDANQSIYGFRDADVTVFLDLIESEEMAAVTLDENRRSQPAVLEGINALAQRILKPPDLDPASTLARGAKALVQMKPAATPKRPPVEHPAIDALYLIGERRQPPAVEEARMAVPAILDRAAQLGLQYSDIAILCPTNQYLGIYAAELRRLGIPSLSLQSGGLLSRPECQDLLAYLELLLDAQDQERFVRVATSPIAGLSAPEVMSVLDDHRATRGARVKAPDPAFDSLALTHPDVFNAHQRVTALVGRTSVAGLAEAIVHEHGYDLALEANDPTGAQLRNIERLIAAIGRVEQRLTGPSIRQVLDQLPVDDENVDLQVPAGVCAVRLMTTFGAKGLEFPLVAIVRMSWAPPSERGRALAGRDGSVGVSLAGRSTSSLIQARDERNAAQKDERRRVAYVAITRPKYHLMLVGSGYVTSKGELSWAGMAGMVFKEALGLNKPLPPRAADIVAIPGTDIPVRVTRLDPKHPCNAPPRPPRATAAPDLTDTEEDDLTIPQPMAAGAISYSQLEKWSKCGLRRYLERDLGLRGDDSRLAADTTGEGTLGIGDPDRNGREFGHLVHECLERVDWKVGVDVPALAAWASAHRGLTPGEAPRLTSCLERARDHEVAATLATAIEVRTEAPFAALINGYLITGVIDVLATLPDGSTLIVDWKTGEHFKEHRGDHELQMSIYVEATSAAMDAGSSIATKWVALEGDGEVTESRIHEPVSAVMNAPPQQTTAVADGRCTSCPGLMGLCPVAA